MNENIEAQIDLVLNDEAYLTTLFNNVVCNINFETPIMNRI